MMKISAPVGVIPVVINLSQAGNYGISACVTQNHLDK